MTRGGVEGAWLSKGYLGRLLAKGSQVVPQARQIDALKSEVSALRVAVGLATATASAAKARDVTSWAYYIQEQRQHRECLERAQSVTSSPVLWCGVCAGVSMGAAIGLAHALPQAR